MIRILTNTISRFIRFLFSRSGVFCVLVIIIAALPHAVNMFHYPYYENDEGTYMSQAWSIVTQGKLAPYTYWYDHAPAGWIFIAIWIKITGSIFRFGTAINSGRVFMLIIQICSALFLYYIARKMSKSELTGLLAATLFSIAPLAIYFHRRVLLDNIMIFWVLASLSVLLTKRIRLKQIALSAVFFGIGVLTKESAIFLIPGYLYIIHRVSDKSNKRFAIVTWLTIMLFIVSLYFLYALIKFELLPEGFLVSYPHVSLITTLKEQMQRGSNLPFWDTRSEFYINLREWMDKDSLIMIVGSGASIICSVIYIWRKNLRAGVILTVFYTLFLIRGKIVIDFYIIPLLVLFSLNTALLIGSLPKRTLMTVLALIIFVTLYFSNSLYKYQFIQDETTPQIKAINWIKNNLDSNDIIAIDNYAYVDLHDRKSPNEKIFPHAEWVWKIERDEEVKKNRLQKNWKNIQYILLSHETVKQIKNHEFPITKQTLTYSSLIADWSSNSTSFIDLKKYISTNGDWARIYKIKNEDEIRNINTWNYFKDHFISSYGQVVDANHNYKTTSDTQAFAMLRALVENDKNAFNGIWKWTRDHLQYRKDDMLFSSVWEKDENDFSGVTDYRSSSAADTDIATALGIAYIRFGQDDYLDEAKLIINDIWKQEVVTVGNRYYIRSSSGETHNGYYLINMGSISPASYRIFALIDKSHPWDTVAADSYTLLKEIALRRTKNLQSPLPSNYYLLNINTGSLSSAKSEFGVNADFSGDQTAKLLWNTQRDAVWFYTKDSSDYIDSIRPFLKEIWFNKKHFSAVYDEDGTEVVPFGSSTMNAALVAIFSDKDPDIAKSLYKSSTQAYYQEAGYWPNALDLNDQNMHWLSNAFITHRLTILDISP